MSRPVEWDRTCVWCGIRGEGRNYTTHHGGPYHLNCLPPFPKEVYRRMAALIGGKG